MINNYDFYKTKHDTEYPEVDGPLSLSSYVAALDASYSRYREKVAKSKKQEVNGRLNGKETADLKASVKITDFDYTVFHSPYGKQVQKGHARLLWNDFMSNPHSEAFASIPDASNLLSIPYAKSLTDKAMEKTFIAYSKSLHATQVEPTMRCAKRCGNMYTASLYGGLASLISTKNSSELMGKRISMFAYGSGAASTFFAIRVKGDTTEMQEKMDLLARLKAMQVVPCQEFVDALMLREKNHNAAPYAPQGSIDSMWPGAYYLESIDSKYRRKYAVVPN